MFDLDRFIDDCKQAVKADPTHKAAHEILQRSLGDTAGIIKALGEPTKPGSQVLHHADDLTIINIAWAPSMTIYPHNHDMWAVIGMYAGREDNVFWRRLPGEDNRIEAAGARSLSTGQCTPLGADIIHSVTNPIPKISAAIHIYGGDFFAAHRSQWDPEDLTEEPYNFEQVSAVFERAVRAAAV